MPTEVKPIRRVERTRKGDGPEIIRHIKKKKSLSKVVVTRIKKGSTRRVIHRVQRTGELLIKLRENAFTKGAKLGSSVLTRKVISGAEVTAFHVTSVRGRNKISNPQKLIARGGGEYKIDLPLGVLYQIQVKHPTYFESQPVRTYFTDDKRSLSIYLRSKVQVVMRVKTRTITELADPIARALASAQDAFNGQDLNGALENIETAIHATNNSDAHYAVYVRFRALIYNAIARVNEVSGNSTESLKFSNKALEDDPGNPLYLLQRLLVLSQFGFLENMKDDLDTLIKTVQNWRTTESYKESFAKDLFLAQQFEQPGMEYDAVKMVALRMAMYYEPKNSAIAAQWYKNAIKYLSQGIKNQSSDELKDQFREELGNFGDSVFRATNEDALLDISSQSMELMTLEDSSDDIKTILNKANAVKTLYLSMGDPNRFPPGIQTGYALILETIEMYTS